MPALQSASNTPAWYAPKAPPPCRTRTICPGNFCGFVFMCRPICQGNDKRRLLTELRRSLMSSGCSTMLSPDRRSTWHHAAALARACGARGEMSAGLGLAYALIQVLGLLAAGKAVMEARTAQGATAWAVALVAFPLLALPLFLVFGQHRFHDYVAARRTHLAAFRAAQQRMRAVLRRRGLLVASRYTQPLERLSGLPFTDGNSAALLIDGDATFGSIFEGIAAARDYVLVQFYILRDDGLGRRAARAAAGARRRRRAGAPAVRQGRQLRPAARLRRRAAGRRRRGAGVRRPRAHQSVAPELPQPSQDRRGGRPARLGRRPQRRRRIPRARPARRARGATRTCASRGRWCSACRFRASRTGTGRRASPCACDWRPAAGGGRRAPRAVPAHRPGR